MTRRLLEGHRELQFRVSLIRSTLLVDTAPSKENIEQLAYHILSEVDQLAHTEKNGPSSSVPKGDPLKLKSLEAEGGEKTKNRGRDGPNKESQSKTRPRCKFYLTDGGCRRGKDCSWPHEGGDGRRRCYVCGSVEHLAPNFTRPKAPTDGRPKKQKSIKDLLEEANRMLKSLTPAANSSSETSKEGDTKEDVMQRQQQQLSSMKLKKLQLKRMAKGQILGLIDSGATNPLRPPRKDADVERYRKVVVALADGTECHDRT
eukprot:s865_g8.t1